MIMGQGARRTRAVSGCHSFFFWDYSPEFALRAEEPDATGSHPALASG